MAIPTKSSRPISVNNQNYRWMVRRCPGPVGKRPSMRLTVEKSETGEIQQKDFDIPKKLDESLEEYSSTITPADVKEFILYRFE